MPTVLGLTNERRTQTSSPGRWLGAASKESKEKDKESKKKKEKDRTTIWGRTQADAREMDTLLWRALCDEPSTALEYAAHDCAIIQPLLFGKDEEVVHGTEDLKKALEDVEPFLGYRISDFQPVEVGLMAVSTVYRVTVTVQGRKGPEQIECLGSSAWRQTAGAEWQLTGHLCAPAP